MENWSDGQDALVSVTLEFLGLGAQSGARFAIAFRTE
jgi:hypothetical protein